MRQITQENIDNFILKNIIPKKDKIKFLMSFKMIRGQIIRNERYYKEKFELERKKTFFEKIVMFIKNIFKKEKNFKIYTNSYRHPHSTLIPQKDRD